MNTAMTEKVNLLTHVVSLLLSRIHLTLQGTCWHPCPWLCSLEQLLSLPGSSVLGQQEQSLSATPAEFPKALMGKDLITLLFPAL